MAAGPRSSSGVRGEGFFSNSLPRNSISWSAPDRPLPREVEPRAVFDRMFRPPSGGASNRSVMDAVLDDANALRRVASRADQVRLDEYFESIRALEQRIEFSERRSRAMANDGALPDTLTPPEPGIPADHQEYVRTMLDLLVAAFQSDATRVATFMLDHGQSNRYFNFIPGVRGTWHALSHYKNASGQTEDRVRGHPRRRQRARPQRPAHPAGGRGAAGRSAAGARSTSPKRPTSPISTSRCWQRMGVAVDRFGNSSTPMHEIDA